MRYRDCCVSNIANLVGSLSHDLKGLEVTAATAVAHTADTSDLNQLTLYGHRSAIQQASGLYDMETEKAAARTFT